MSMDKPNLKYVGYKLAYYVPGQKWIQLDPTQPDQTCLPGLKFSRWTWAPLPMWPTDPQDGMSCRSRVPVR